MSDLCQDYDPLIPAVRARLPIVLLSGSGVTNDEEAETYYEDDVMYVMKSDYEVRRFLIDSNGKIDTAVKSLVASLKWRKSQRLRHLTDSYFPSEVWYMGAIFLYEPDRWDRPVLHMRLKTNIRVKELTPVVQHFVSYLSFKLESMGREMGYTVVVDFKGVSLRNCDLEMASFVLHLKSVFPNGLRLLLAVDCPLIAHAAWNLVKYAVPADQRHIMKMIPRSEVCDYIKPENLPNYLGGCCKRKFCGPSVVPPGSKSAADFAVNTLGLSLKRAEQIIETYKPFLKEADELQST